MKSAETNKSTKMKQSKEIKRKPRIVYNQKENSKPWIIFSTPLNKEDVRKDKSTNLLKEIGQISSNVLNWENNTFLSGDTSNAYNRASLRSKVEAPMSFFLSMALGMVSKIVATYDDIMQSIREEACRQEMRIEKTKISFQTLASFFVDSVKRKIKSSTYANRKIVNAFKAKLNVDVTKALQSVYIFANNKTFNGSEEYVDHAIQDVSLLKGKTEAAHNGLVLYNNQIPQWFLLIELFRCHVLLCVLYAIHAMESTSFKKCRETTVHSFRMNVATAEYFESALRESFRIQLQLTFTHIHTVDNRIPTAVPIYRDGFIYRKDGH